MEIKIGRKSKLTNEELAHYLKGGKFRAIYNPRRNDDLARGFTAAIGEHIIVWQNLEVAPIASGRYEGQHRFNCTLSGWIPEEDLLELQPIYHDHIEFVEPVPVYCYRLLYDREEQFEPNFGKGTTFKGPMWVDRSYSQERDEWVKELSNPQATEIWKAVWDPKVDRELHWTQIL